MRSSKSRSRSKSNRQRSFGNVVNRVFDSSGPDGKVRGTPQQIIEKYLMLARDAQLSNDRVAEQAFLQHAEHYTRMLSEAQRELAREQESRQGQPGNGNATGNGNGNGQTYQGSERGDAQRDRHDQRGPRDDDDEQPYFAPLGAVTADDGRQLVETPEMRHAARPQNAPREHAVAEQPAAPDVQPDGGQRTARPERGPRGPRGPRKPREPRERAEGQGPDAGAVATESSENE